MIHKTLTPTEKKVERYFHCALSEKDWNDLNRQSEAYEKESPQVKIRKATQKELKVKYSPERVI